MIAFVGLAVRGLVAAGLGSSRSERIAALTAIGSHRELCDRWCATGIALRPPARGSRRSSGPA